METLMIPMARVEGTEIGGRPRGARSGDDASFSGHLERTLADRRRDESNRLDSRRDESRRAEETNREARVKRDTNSVGESSAREDSKRASRSEDSRRSEDDERDSERLEAVPLTTLIGEYLELLRLEAEAVENGPGNFTVTLVDIEQLTSLAAAAGMDEADAALLMERFAAGRGELEMGDLLAHLSRHFLSLQEEQPVPVPETDLPYLQMLLSKMGVSPEDMAALAEQATPGNNTLDLAAFVQGLRDLEISHSSPGAGEISLTGWDAEQLLSILDSAGVSRALQRELLPELHAPWDQPQRPNQPLKLDAERLLEILGRGVAEVEASRPRPEVVGFLNQLKEIFNQAGFNDQRVGWSPVVQGAAEKIYTGLMESVDLATVRINRASGDNKSGIASLLGMKQGQAGDRSATDALDNMEFVELEENIAELDSDLTASRESLRLALAEIGLGSSGTGDSEEFSGGLFMGTTQEDILNAAKDGESVTIRESAADFHRNEITRTFNQPSRFNSQLEQQIFNRVSEGVASGLRRNEHHLVMHLYPRELGEVKVEMMVRDNQVSLSFSMESTRVKEILEKNMDMFRENLERRGFNIGECMVNLDQNSREDSAETWQRFASAWSNQQGNMVRRESPAALPENTLYLRPLSSREQGVDLFA